MPGIPAGSTVQVTIEYEHFEQTLMNVLHYTCVEEATVGTIAAETQAIADIVGGAGAGNFVARLRSILPATCKIVTMRVQVVGPTRFAYRFKTVNLSGQRGDSYTANVDTVITKRTDSAGRGKQSDFYLPGLDAADAINGVITAGFLADLVSNVTFIRDGIVTSNGGLYAPVIWKRRTNTVTPITSSFIHTTVRVMTRRTVGRGI